MNLQNKLNLMEVLDYFDDNFLKKIYQKNIAIVITQLIF